jgi:hypothetical protein
MGFLEKRFRETRFCSFAMQRESLELKFADELSASYICSRLEGTGDGYISNT